MPRIRCRMRRVKCDKVLPACAHCIASGLQCTYLARRPRKSQKAQPDLIVRKPLRPADRRAREGGDIRKSSKPALSPPVRQLATDDGNYQADDSDGGDAEDSEDALIP